MAAVDAEVQNHGSIAILMPFSDAAKAWVAEHIPVEATRWGDGVVIEPRYVDDIVTGMQGDGLVVA